MALQAWQQRVVDERQALLEKRMALGVFLTGQSIERTVSADELLRMHRQEMFMRGYTDVLGERINAFTEA